MQNARAPAAGCVALLAALLLVACADANRAVPAAPRAGAGSIPVVGAPASAPNLREWPEFGLDAQRSDATDLSTGISVANLAQLRRVRVSLPGTVDSSAVYAPGVALLGGRHDLIVLTTTYGRALAIDASSARIVWSFTPAGYRSWAGSAQFTTTSPVLDPDRRYVYSASPDGLIHKLNLSSGREVRSAGWPARVTLEPRREKLAAALNIDGADVLAATGGYFGDAPPYQGHLVAIDRESGRIVRVFNTLCSNRPTLQLPSTCAASDSAILSRGGAVVEPGGARILIDTGNGPWNGSSELGDSVLELSFPRLSLLQSFTPTDQAYLNANDTDLGSSAPVLLGHDRVLVAGKDGVMRVLELSRLDGRAPGRRRAGTLGGEVQRLELPGGGQLFSAPAVWQHGGRTTVFIGAESATAALVLRNGRLHSAWQNETPGTSPVLAGGLLYVYDPAAGGIYVYRPTSAHPIAKLPGDPGHWNSPIVVARHVIEPEGNANDHSQRGTLDIFTAP